MVKGSMHGEVGHAWQRGACVGGMHCKGVCVARGACMARGEGVHAGETATEVGSMHPTECILVINADWSASLSPRY